MPQVIISIRTFNDPSATNVSRIIFKLKNLNTVNFNLRNYNWNKIKIK